MVDLLNCKTKRDLEKYCRSFVLKSHDFALAIRIAMIGGFDPHQYASSFRQWSPDHLALEERDLKALSVNGIGPFTPAAKKAANKIFQMLEDRRMLARFIHDGTNVASKGLQRQRFTACRQKVAAVPWFWPAKP